MLTVQEVPKGGVRGVGLCVRGGLEWGLKRMNNSWPHQWEPSLCGKKVWPFLVQAGKPWMLEMRWPPLSQLREKRKTFYHSLEARLRREERLKLNKSGRERVSVSLAKGRERGQNGHMLERGAFPTCWRERERYLACITPLFGALYAWLLLTSLPPDKGQVLCLISPHATLCVSHTLLMACIP